MSGYKVSMMDGGKARLELVGEISWWRNSSSDFSRAIKELESTGVNELELYINSPGGSVFDANEIVNVLKLSPCKKSIARIGALCASAATIVALAFDNVVIAENGMFMIHDPYMDVWDATEKKMKSSLELLSQLKQGIVRVYTKKTGKPDDEILQMMDVETWLSADKTVEHGFADSVEGFADADEQTEMMAGVKSFKYKHLPMNYSGIKSNFDMKKVVLALGLSEGASEEAMEQAVVALKEKVGALELERVEALVDNAIQEKKIPAGDREQWVKDAQANYPLSKRLLGSMQSVPKISNQLNPAKKQMEPKNDLDKILSKDDLSFDDLMKDAEVLDQVREKHPSTYAKLYKEKFGIECVFED